MAHYYNEWEPYAAAWLRNLIVAGHLPPGDVDQRSIVDVQPEDVRGYTQAHFFAGIGGWPLAARLAGWSDARPLCTGSCPCQPFSVAGTGGGKEDPRHLWPDFFRIIAGTRPPVVMGEQVAAAVGKHWLDGVFADLEGIGYACGAAVVPACAVDAPQRRDRLWFVAGADKPFSSKERQQRGGQFLRAGGDPQARHQHGGEALAGAHGAGLPLPEQPGGREPAEVGDGETQLRQAAPQRGRPSPWAGAGWLGGADGKARRVEPGLRLLAHGVPGRVGQLRALGNAIVPEEAAEVIAAWMDVAP